MSSNPNLIVNGDFSKGNRGFTNDYNYVKHDPAYHTEFGDFSVIKNPGTQFNNSYDSYGDHTTGHGKMLFLDGSETGSNFWAENIMLASDTTYNFTYFVTGSDSGNPAQIAVTLDGNTVDAGFVVSGFGGDAHWQQVTVSFTTTAAGSYALALHDVNEMAPGNDFTIDDLKLVAGKPGGHAIAMGAALEPIHHLDALFPLHTLEAHPAIV